MHRLTTGGSLEQMIVSAVRYRVPIVLEGAKDASQSRTTLCKIRIVRVVCPILFLRRRVRKNLTRLGWCGDELYPANFSGQLFVTSHCFPAQNHKNTSFR